MKRSFRTALAAWQDASESVEGQLNDIRKALSDTDDDDLHRIAEYGLNGIIGGQGGVAGSAVGSRAGTEAVVPPLAKKVNALVRSAITKHIRTAQGMPNFPRDGRV